MRIHLGTFLLASAFSIPLGASACSKSSPSTGDTTPKPVGKTCDDATANARGLLGEMASARAKLGESSDSSSPQITSAQVDQAASLVGASCVDNAWSRDAIECVATADREKLRDCMQLLDATVASRLDTDIEAKLSSTAR